MSAVQSITPCPQVVFVHGNGFPGGTYSEMLRHLGHSGYQVHALDKLGHEPHLPVTSNWPHLVTQLADYAAQAWAPHNGPAYLVGHSMGGLLSLMCAAQHPLLGGKRIAGVVMIDSPVLGGWRAHLMALVKGSRLVHTLPVVKKTRQRRQRWSSLDEALNHFARRPTFANWHPQALQDYLEHGTHDEPTAHGMQRTLRFNREVESLVYRTIPHHLDRFLRRHPLACPVAFIGATESKEMQQAGLENTRRLIEPNIPERFQILPGTHLLPMEQPQATAEAVAQALRSFERINPPS